MNELRAELDYYLAALKAEKEEIQKIMNDSSLEEIKNLKKDIEEIKVYIKEAAALKNAVTDLKVFTETKNEALKSEILAVPSEISDTLKKRADNILKEFEEELKRTVDKRIRGFDNGVRNVIDRESSFFEKRINNIKEFYEELNEKVDKIQKELNEFHFSKFYKIYTFLSVGTFSFLIYYVITGSSEIKNLLYYIMKILQG